MVGEKEMLGERVGGVGERERDDKAVEGRERGGGSEREQRERERSWAEHV